MNDLITQEAIATFSHSTHYSQTGTDSNLPQVDLYGDQTA